MGWIKLIQSAAFYIGAIVYTLDGQAELSMLALIAACLCDIAYILEEKR